MAVFYRVFHFPVSDQRNENTSSQQINNNYYERFQCLLQAWKTRVLFQTKEKQNGTNNIDSGSFLII